MWPFKKPEPAPRPIQHPDTHRIYLKPAAASENKAVRLPKEPRMPETLRIAVVRFNDCIVANGSNDKDDDDIINELCENYDGVPLGIWWVEVEVPDNAPKLNVK